jgi:hypothetical protein
MRGSRFLVAIVAHEGDRRKAAWQPAKGHFGLHSFRRPNITMRQDVGARSHLADPISGRGHCVRASFESITNRDSCVARRSSSGRSATGREKAFGWGDHLHAEGVGMYGGMRIRKAITLKARQSVFPRDKICIMFDMPNDVGKELKGK